MKSWLLPHLWLWTVVALCFIRGEWGAGLTISVLAVAVSMLVYVAHGYNTPRADRNLKAHLDCTQIVQMQKRHGFFVEGSDGGQFWICTGGTVTENVLRQTKNGAVKYCFAPRGILPRGDIFLAQKFALESDELRALSVAIRGRYMRPWPM